MGRAWRGLVAACAAMTIAAGCGRTGSVADDGASDSCASAACLQPLSTVSIKAPPSCQPTGGGPYWLQEGDPLSVHLSCQTGLALPGSAFAVSPLPRGANFDPQSATLSWTPDLKQAAVYLLKVAVAQSGEESELKIGVADKFDDLNNHRVVDPSQYTEEYGLPVFFLTVPSGLGNVYAPAKVLYRGHTYSVQAKLHGGASLAFPKKSYTLHFEKSDPFLEPAFAGGMVRDKIVLVTTFSDNSYVRQRFAYDYFNQLDPTHFQIKTYSAVVFVNGSYRGLYTVTDHVDTKTLAVNGWLGGGNLYKPETNDANFLTVDRFGAPKSSLHQGYLKDSGLPPDGAPGAYDDLEALVGFVTQSSASTFASQFPTMARLSEFQDWWAFVTTIRASDSTRKNYFLYHPPSGGQWRYIPWDYRSSLGQDWQTRREAADSPSDYSGENGLFRQLLSDPPLAAQTRQRLHDQLRSQGRLEVARQLLDGYFPEIDECALRDERRWGGEYRSFSLWMDRTDFTDYEGEKRYVREWVEARWRYLRGRY